jgi:hypothetical protein
LTVVTTSFLLSSCVPTTGQQAYPGGDWLFSAGTQWTYDGLRKKGQEQRGSFTVRVTKIEKGIAYLLYGNRDTAPNSLTPNEGVQWIGDGGLCSASIYDGKILGGQMLYKFGSKKGDTWVYDP